MTQFLQTLIDGLAVGSVYALIALGYTMVYGVLRFINFAHGDIVTLGAWIGYSAARVCGWTETQAAPPLYAAFLIPAFTVLACAALGLLIERLAYRPLANAPRLNVLITAIGVSILLQNIGQHPMVFGAQPVRMPALLPDWKLARVADVTLHLVDVMVIGGALALMLGLQALVYRTRFGLAMRAVSHDRKVAALMGVNVDAVISITFVLGAALAGAAGFLFAQKYSNFQQPAHGTWVLLGLKAFVAAVVGGIGDIRGAMVGGVLIGLLEFFGAAYLSSDLRDVYVFALLIAVLLVKPTGLMGKPQVEKV